MKILYDLSYTQNKSFYSGLYEYGKKIFHTLVQSGHKVSVLLLKSAEIDSWITDSNIDIELVESPFESKKYWKEIEEILKNYDRVIFPYQLIKGKIRVPSNCELYFTIHDLAQIELAKFGRINKQEKYYHTLKDRLIKYNIKQALRLTGLWWRHIVKVLNKNIKKATKIITISYYSKEQIKKYFKLPDSKIEVCYAPLKHLSCSKESKLTYNNYFLFVSASRYTKNTKRALDALDRIWDKNPSFPSAIITGNLPRGVSKRIKHKEKIELLGYINEEDLEYLYKNAVALIFPSLCEGFGSPPLEAMRYGTRVICSNAMSLKELYSNTLLFDPYDVNDIMDKISKYDSLKKEDMLSIYNEINNKCEKDLKKLIDIITTK